MSEKIIMEPKDFNLVRSYLENKPLPHKETKQVFEALYRAEMSKVKKDESKSVESDKKSSQGDGVISGDGVEAKE